MRRCELVLFLAAALAPAASGESARSLVSKGNEAFEKGNYQEALALYEAAGREKPDLPAVWFNKGDALYRQGRFDEAADAYEQAAMLSDDAWLQARSKFNRGNAEFRKGLAAAQADPVRAVDALEQSVRDWRDALRSDPSLDDARHNIEVARIFLDRLRQQLRKQPQRAGRRNQRKQDRRQQASAGGERDRQRQQARGNQPPRRPPAGRPEEQKGRQGRRLQAAEKPEDILKEERENRRRRVRAMARIEPVDKDW